MTPFPGTAHTASSAKRPRSAKPSLRANAEKMLRTIALFSAAATRALPAVDEPLDVTALCIREGNLRDEPSRLGRIVVVDRRLQMLAEGRRLSKLPPQPAKQAHRGLVGHGREAIARRSHPRDRDNGPVKEILPEIEAWKKEGERVVVATVVATRRSAPRPIGT